MRATQNWSGHIKFSSSRYHEPETIEQVQNIVRNADKVSVIGSRHSFNDIADTTGDLIWLGNLKSDIEIDSEHMKATVSAGITYDELCPELESAGLALPNLASLKHITVVGACITATHGSGDKNRNLSASISAFEMITSDGNLIKLSREQDPEIFPGAIITLGALGVITRITLDLVPSFLVQQDAYEKLSYHTLFENFDEITSSAYSVSFFTTWQYDFCDTFWTKRKIDANRHLEVPNTFYGANHRPPEIASQTDEVRKLTPFGKPTIWHEQLNHYYFYQPEAEGNELQSEYFIPRAFAVDALKAIRTLKKELAPILGLSEIRTIAADDLWLSPAYESDCIGIHFNWLKKGKEVEQFLPTLEKKLAPFSARPHFGKLFAMDNQKLNDLYPRFNDFKKLLFEFDPDSKFSNTFITRLFRK